MAKGLKRMAVPLLVSGAVALGSLAAPASAIPWDPDACYQRQFKWCEANWRPFGYESWEDCVFYMYQEMCTWPEPFAATGREGSLWIPPSAA